MHCGCPKFSGQNERLYEKSVALSSEFCNKSDIKTRSSSDQHLRLQI